METTKSKNDITEYKKQLVTLQKENTFLKKENKRLKGRITRLEKKLKTITSQKDKQITKLKQKIKKLKDEKALDSTNSSKPPSTDIFKKNRKKKPSTKKRRSRSHKGVTLKPVSKPDIIITKNVDKCECCGNDIDKRSGEYCTRQLFDFPYPKIEVTEYRAERNVCPHCDTVNTAGFPDGVNSKVQYGNNIKSLIAYLNIGQFIPYNRIKDLFKDYFKHDISEGFIQKCIDKASNNLIPFSETVKGILKSQDVINLDETSLNVNKRKAWVHITCTDFITFLQTHRRRGREALEDIGIYPDFSGISVTDNFTAYDFNKSCFHAYCNAHNIRDLKYVIENGYPYERDWCIRMRNCLLHMKKLVDTSKSNGNNSLSSEIVSQLMNYYDSVLNDALKVYNPSTIKRKHTLSKNKDRNQPYLFPEVYEESQLLPEHITDKSIRRRTKGENLLHRFLNKKSGILKFLTDFRVPFTNNLSERGFRMVKLKQKVSGCFRGLIGANKFCLIYSYISTVNKHGLDVFDMLIKAFQGDPFIPDPAPP